MDMTRFFGNPLLSDINVVLSTERPEAYRRRLAAASAPPVKKQAVGTGEPPQLFKAAAADADAGSGSSSSDGTPPLCEVIPAHKLVLFCHSEYFSALERWENDPASHHPSSRKRCHGASSQVAVISLPSEAWFGAARSMLRFMYTQQLDPGLSRLQTLQLLALGNQYSLAHLRCACLQRLNAVPLWQWSAGEKLSLCGLVEVVDADTAAGGRLTDAATALIASVLHVFGNLEEAWRSRELRAFFCSLPYAVVLKVLGSDALAVRSENTVLVAALSWLGAGGERAPAEQRRQVLLQVRLQHLSPHFIAWLSVCCREFLDLVPAATRTDLLLGLGLRGAVAASPHAGGRRGPALGPAPKLKATASRQAVLDAVARCRGGVAEEVNFSSAPVRLDGFVRTAEILVYSVPDGAGGRVVKVWAGACTCVVLGAGEAGPALDGFDSFPYHYRMSVGSRLSKVVVQHASSKENPGCFLAELREGDDAEGALQGCFGADGNLVARIALLG